jgi:hypothetical protein
MFGARSEVSKPGSGQKGRERADQYGGLGAEYKGIEQNRVFRKVWLAGKIGGNG